MDEIREALRDGLREEAAPIGRRLAEVKGLSNNAIRRLAGIEAAIEAERNARLDDVTLREHVGLEPLEPADHLVREALHLGQPARDRRRLFAQPVSESAADGVGQDDLELVGRLGQRFDLEPCPLERCGDVRRERVAVVHPQRR